MLYYINQVEHLNQGPRLFPQQTAHLVWKRGVKQIHEEVRIIILTILTRQMSHTSNGGMYIDSCH